MHRQTHRQLSLPLENHSSTGREASEREGPNEEGSAERGREAEEDREREEDGERDSAMRNHPDTKVPAASEQQAVSHHRRPKRPKLTNQTHFILQ